MANEKRLIDTDVMMGEVYDSDEKHGNDVWHTEDIEYLVMAQPTVDAVEVVHGYNVRQDWPSLFECSICHWSDDDTYTGDTGTYNYCPNCGAKMDGDGNG